MKRRAESRDLQRFSLQKRLSMLGRSDFGGSVDRESILDENTDVDYNRRETQWWKRLDDNQRRVSDTFFANNTNKSEDMCEYNNIVIEQSQRIYMVSTQDVSSVEKFSIGSVNSFSSMSPSIDFTNQKGNLFQRNKMRIRESQPLPDNASSGSSNRIKFVDKRLSNMDRSVLSFVSMDDAEKETPKNQFYPKKSLFKRSTDVQPMNKSPIYFPSPTHSETHMKSAEISDKDDEIKTLFKNRKTIEKGVYAKALESTTNFTYADKNQDLSEDIQPRKLLFRTKGVSNNDRKKSVFAEAVSYEKSESNTESVFFPPANPSSSSKHDFIEKSVSQKELLKVPVENIISAIDNKSDDDESIKSDFNQASPFSIASESINYEKFKQLASSTVIGGDVSPKTPFRYKGARRFMQPLTASNTNNIPEEHEHSNKSIDVDMENKPSESFEKNNLGETTPIKKASQLESLRNSAKNTSKNLITRKSLRLSNLDKSKSNDTNGSYIDVVNFTNQNLDYLGGNQETMGESPDLIRKSKLQETNGFDSFIDHGLDKKKLSQVPTFVDPVTTKKQSIMALRSLDDIEEHLKSLNQSEIDRAFEEEMKAKRTNPPVRRSTIFAIPNDDNSLMDNTNEMESQNQSFVHRYPFRHSNVPVAIHANVPLDIESQTKKKHDTDTSILKKGLKDSLLDKNYNKNEHVQKIIEEEVNILNEIVEVEDNINTSISSNEHNNFVDASLSKEHNKSDRNINVQDVNNSKSKSMNKSASSSINVIKTRASTSSNRKSISSASIVDKSKGRDASISETKNNSLENNNEQNISHKMAVEEGISSASTKESEVSLHDNIINAANIASDDSKNISSERNSSTTTNEQNYSLTGNGSNNLINANIDASKRITDEINSSITRKEQNVSSNRNKSRTSITTIEKSNSPHSEQNDSIDIESEPSIRTSNEAPEKQLNISLNDNLESDISKRITEEINHSIIEIKENSISHANKSSSSSNTEKDTSISSNEKDVSLHLNKINNSAYTISDDSKKNNSSAIIDEQNYSSNDNRTISSSDAENNISKNISTEMNDITVGKEQNTFSDSYSSGDKANVKSDIPEVNIENVNSSTTSEAQDISRHTINTNESDDSKMVNDGKMQNMSLNRNKTDNITCAKIDTSEGVRKDVDSSINGKTLNMSSHFNKQRNDTESNTSKMSIDEMNSSSKNKEQDIVFNQNTKVDDDITSPAISKEQNILLDENETGNEMDIGSDINSLTVTDKQNISRNVNMVSNIVQINDNTLKSTKNSSVDSIEQNISSNSNRSSNITNAESDNLKRFSLELDSSTTNKDFNILMNRNDTDKIIIAESESSNRISDELNSSSSNKTHHIPSSDDAYEETETSKQPTGPINEIEQFVQEDCSLKEKNQENKSEVYEQNAEKNTDSQINMKSTNDTQTVDDTEGMVLEYHSDENRTYYDSNSIDLDEDHIEHNSDFTRKTHQDMEFTLMNDSEHTLIDHNKEKSSVANLHVDSEKILNSTKPKSIINTPDNTRFIEKDVIIDNTSETRNGKMYSFSMDSLEMTPSMTLNTLNLKNKSSMIKSIYKPDNRKLSTISVRTPFFNRDENIIPTIDTDVLRNKFRIMNNDVDSTTFESEIDTDTRDSTFLLNTRPTTYSPNLKKHQSTKRNAENLAKYLNKLKDDEESRKKRTENILANIFDSRKNLVENLKHGKLLKNIEKPIKKKVVKPKMPQQVKPVNEVENAVDMMIGKVHKAPKLYMKEQWITPRLYNFVQKKIEAKYGLRTRSRSEKFVKYLAEIVNTVTKSKKNYNDYILQLKNEMSRLKLVDTHFDFHCFVKEYLPFHFRIRSIPACGRDVPVITDVFESIRTKD